MTTHHRLAASLAVIVLLSAATITRADTVTWDHQTWNSTNDNDLKVIGTTDPILRVFTTCDPTDPKDRLPNPLGKGQIYPGGAHYTNGSAFHTATSASETFSVIDPGTSSKIGYDLLVERTSDVKGTDEQVVRFGALPGLDKYFVIWNDYDVKKNGKLAPIPTTDVAVFGHRTAGEHTLTVTQLAGGHVSFSVDGTTYFTETGSSFTSDFYFGDTTLRALAGEGAPAHYDVKHVDFTHYAAAAVPVPHAVYGGLGLMGLMLAIRSRKRSDA